MIAGVGRPTALHGASVSVLRKLTKPYNVKLATR